MKYEISDFDRKYNHKLFSAYEIELCDLQATLTNPILDSIIADNICSVAYQTINGRTFKDMLFLPMFKDIFTFDDDTKIVQTFMLLVGEQPIIWERTQILAILYKNKNDLLKLKLSL